MRLTNQIIICTHVIRYKFRPIGRQVGLKKENEICFCCRLRLDCCLRNNITGSITNDMKTTKQNIIAQPPTTITLSSRRLIASCQFSLHMTEDHFNYFQLERERHSHRSHAARSCEQGDPVEKVEENTQTSK